MTFLWLLAGAALAAALVAWRQARATARRLDQLTQMYWELRYQHGELRVKVQRLSGEPPPAVQAADDGPPPGFVPLSSLKR
jgi:predicted NodU family carbamoyl transferase